jgi:hypothetical protein
LTGKRKDQPKQSMVKVVYFDEQSASDYLDISAGGQSSSTSEDVRKRATEVHSNVEAKLAAKLSWLPFLGANAEAGAGLDISRAGQSILSKTLSNTILTDYVEKVADDGRVRILRNFQVTAPQDSMAHIKMYTPYMVIAKTEGQGIDLARLDEALESAKGYYELIGESTSETRERCVLRFNIKAFRNNYGLTDLARMRLVYHAVLVGQTAESSLSLQAEMSPSSHSEPPSALELLDPTRATTEMLNVYDVLLAGVEHVE